MNTPNPFNNPTLEGYEVLHTSPVIVGVFQRPHRALVCRYSDPARPTSTFVLWQKRSARTGEFTVIPGSNHINCEALIKVLLATKEA